LERAKEEMAKEEVVKEERAKERSLTASKVSWMTS
jgi:hypothetical protein